MLAISAAPPLARKGCASSAPTLASRVPSPLTSTHVRMKPCSSSGSDLKRAGQRKGRRPNCGVLGVVLVEAVAVVGGGRKRG